MVLDDVASGAFGTFAPNIKQFDFACELGRGESSFFINFEATLLGTEVVLHEDIRFEDPAQAVADLVEKVVADVKGRM